MAAPIRGVLFDKDGTLFDFHSSWARLAEEMLDRLAPAPAARNEMARAAGYDRVARRFEAGSIIVAEPSSALAELWACWRPDLGAARIEAMANAAAAGSVAGTLVPAVEDLAGLLDGFRHRGLALGVATHDEEAATRVQLDAAGILDRFDFIAGYDSGHGLKPGPGMLAAFAVAAGLDPGSVAMIGDSRHDLQMVRSAGGALAIGVLTGPAAEADLAPHADLVIASIAALPDLLDDLVRPNATRI